MQLLACFWAEKTINPSQSEFFPLFKNHSKNQIHWLSSRHYDIENQTETLKINLEFPATENQAKRYNYWATWEEGLTSIERICSESTSWWRFCGRGHKRYHPWEGQAWRRNWRRPQSTLTRCSWRECAIQEPPQTRRSQTAVATWDPMILQRQASMMILLLGLFIRPQLNVDSLLQIQSANITREIRVFRFACDRDRNVCWDCVILDLSIVVWICDENDEGQRRKEGTLWFPVWWFSFFFGFNGMFGTTKGKKIWKYTSCF